MLANYTIPCTLFFYSNSEKIDPATGSPTATLLRLHPSPQSYINAPFMKRSNTSLKKINKINIQFIPHYNSLFHIKPISMA